MDSDRGLKQEVKGSLGTEIRSARAEEVRDAAGQRCRQGRDEAACRETREMREQGWENGGTMERDHLQGRGRPVMGKEGQIAIGTEEIEIYMKR